MADVKIIIKGENQSGTAIKQAADDMRGLADTAESQGSRASGFFSNAFSFATGGLITTGLSAITGSVGGLLSGMISGNGEFERYNAQFTTMLGSADAATQRMADLADFGASTPFELPEVVNADRVLQGFGLHSEEAAKKFGFSGEQIRTIAGDVASGTGTSFEDMSLLIGKFSSGATGEAISRMMELGITNREELAKMGLEFSKSGELLSPLPESMNVVLGLMKTKYGGLMAEQSTTFEGMVSNLQDYVAGTLRTLGQPIFEVVKDKLGALLQFLNDPATLAAISAFADGLATGIGVAMDFVANTAIPALIAAWNTISPAVSVVIGVLGTIITALMGAGSSTTETAGFFQTAWSTIAALVQTYAGLVHAVVTTIFGAVQGFLQQHGAEIQAVLQLAWQTIQQVISTALAIIQNVIIPILSGIAGFIASHGTQITGLLSAAWEIIKSLVTAALGIIQGVIQTVMSLISGDWQGAWDGIQQILTSAWQGIQGALSGALDLLTTALSLALDGLKTIWSNLWGGLAGIVTGIGASLSAAGRGIVENVKQGIQAAWGSLVEWFRGKLGELRDMLPFSPPKDPRSPLRDLPKAGAGILEQIRTGMDAAGPLRIGMPQIGGAGALRFALPGGSLRVDTTPSLRAGAGASAAQPTVRVVLDDRGADLLRQLIRLEIDDHDRATGRGATLRDRMF